MRSNVVLPTPLGPTRPTRWPAKSSNPNSSKSGSASNARRRLEQLNNNMRLLCGKYEECSLGFQEQVHQGGIGHKRPDALKQFGAVVTAVIEPALIRQQEQKTGVVGLTGLGVFQPL